MRVRGILLSIRQKPRKHSRHAARRSIPMRMRRKSAGQRIWPQRQRSGWITQDSPPVKSVEWVGRGPKQETPADIILTLTDEKQFGISAKSTHQSRDIVSRSAGIGTIDTALKTDLVGIRNRAEERFIKKHGLSVEPIRRKEEIRKNAIVRQEANEERTVVLRNIRNKMFTKLSVMPQPKLKQFVSSSLLGEISGGMRYIQVTGHGSGNVTIVDPRKNDKRSAMKTGNIVIAKSGNDSITFQSGDINIARVRIKYGTVPLASPIEVSVDPWSLVGRD